MGVEIFVFNAREIITCDTVPASSLFRGTPVMQLIAVYVVFVLIGEAIAYFIGRAVEHSGSQSLSLTVFLSCFFLVYWIAWILAVWATKPKHA